VCRPTEQNTLELECHRFLAVSPVAVSGRRMAPKSTLTERLTTVGRRTTVACGGTKRGNRWRCFGAAGRPLCGQSSFESWHDTDWECKGAQLSSNSDHQFSWLMVVGRANYVSQDAQVAHCWNWASSLSVGQLVVCVNERRKCCQPSMHLATWCTTVCLAPGTRRSSVSLYIQLLGPFRAQDCWFACLP